MNKAIGILESGVKAMKDRAKTYDAESGENSMPQTLAIFEAITGITMSVEQGWLFMVALKLSRSQQGAIKQDSYTDGSAYFALAYEAGTEERE